MNGLDDWLGGLRDQAQRLIGGNAAALAQPGVGGASVAPTAPPEKQFWNLPAKYAAAERIKQEMLRDYPGHNDAGDAMRHAELSRRLASEIGPLSAHVAGATHELENSIPSSFVQYAPDFMRQHAAENWHGQGTPERLMDERNNAEGRRAAWEGRPIDPSRLQTSPSEAAPQGAPYQPWGRGGASR